MKVTYDWLKDIIPVEMDAQAIAQNLMMRGLEMESFTETGIGKQEVVVVEIIAIDQHPQADRLFVTQVDAGQEKLQVVTNLKGLKPGQKLLVAKLGVKLADGMELKPVKLKGVDSQGMYVGWQELGFDFKSEEPIFVDKSVKNGTPYYEMLPFCDQVIELELTANRGDCLGMLGIAREVNTFSEKDISVPEHSYATNGKPVKDIFSVEIQTPDCHRYCGAVIEHVTIEPSPLWMQLRLVKAGIRPISNVVDITNYVLLEMNQPMHAFDLDKIADHKIIVRDAKQGEKMITLDDIERGLVPGDIVVADKNCGHCLGGVMGSELSEVSDQTKNIFLEAAFFNPPNIRKTSRRLGLRSDSSYRFERHTDKGNIPLALKRALYLFDLLKVGTVYEGIIDEYPVQWQPDKIEFTADWINAKLGSDIPKDTMHSILVDLGF
ncbi:MAG: phenylalanine--tRNA ligase subunit beta, partial [Spirochaetes bacterium]|nr:phenylalanine--tRNA ligase subunit beta [Spirochaetota bacterium]